MSDSTSSTSMPTGATGAGGGNMLRITGLNTGLDIDSIVKKMLAGDQTKIDSAKQQQQIVQWKQEEYQQIISDVKDLQDTFFNVSDSSNYLLNTANYSNMTAVSADTSTINATVQTGAATGTYKISVSQVAEAATISASASLNSQAEIAGDTSAWNGGTITFSINGSNKTITLDNTHSGSDSTAISSLVNDINSKISADSSLNGQVSASYVKDQSGNQYIKFTPSSNSSIKIVSNADTVANPNISDLNSLISSGKNLTSASLSTKLTDLNSNLKEDITLNLNYNGKEISVDLNNSSTGKNGSATVGDLITAIKSATGGAVTGKFDDTTGNFTLQTTATGSTSNLKIEDWLSTHGQSGDTSLETTSDLLSALNMSAGASNQGQDAIVSITSPGQTTPITLTESSNNFTVNGINYSISGTISDASPVNVSVTSDTSKIYNMISNFIDKYNKVVDEIQTKLNEKTDKDYPPLTDSQKSAMNSTDVTNWQNKAKQGILRNDDNLENLLNSLREAFVTPLEDGNGNGATSIVFGTYSSNSIGIDTSNDPTQGGKISITDSSKLKDAIANHGDEIVQLFAGKFNSALNNRYNITSSDLSGWKSGTIDLQANNTDISIDMSGFTGSSLDDLASYINGKITSTSLNNIVTVSTSIDASGTSHIKFVTTESDVYMKAAGISDLPTSSTQLNTDYDAQFNQSGIFSRIKSIFENNVGIQGTTLNSAVLTQYANYQDDYSLYGGTGNTLPDQIYQKQLIVNNLTTQMSDDQTKYYNQFTQLETAMEQLNSQQSALSSYFSG